MGHHDAMSDSTVVAIFLNRGSRAPLTRVAEVQAVADEGLDGDRHRRPGTRRSVLLMPLEDLDAFGLSPGDVREQIVVRGVDLNGLPEGARLRIGEVRLEVGLPCAPCERMNELRAGVREALAGRRGRFVRVLDSGRIAAGQAVEVEAVA